MRIFGREPALLLEAVKALLVVAALWIPGFTKDMQQASIVILAAVFGVLTAMVTIPRDFTVLTEAVQTIGLAIAAFGWNIGPDKLGAITVLVGTVVTLLERNTLSPAAPSTARPAHGYTALQLVGAVVVAALAVIGLVALLR